MNTNLTDTQKFHIANEIAKSCTGQHPAYGNHHWEPVKQEERKNEMPNVKGWLLVGVLTLASILSIYLIIVVVFGG